MKKKKESTGKQKRANLPASAAGPAKAPELSTGRKVIFGFVGFVLLPVLLLVAAEIVLRLTGVGYPTGFFKKIRIGNESFYVENEKFGLRFFPPELARSPSPVVMRATRKPGTYRIFMLGESAILGDPRPAYGVARYVKVLMEERYPGTEFEVICAAVTAINSHAIVDMARECAKHEGDLWVIYMGNNEMVGPFGATTVLGAQAPPLSYIRLNLAIQRTRIGQLLMTAGRKLMRRAGRDSSWGGMKMWTENQIPAIDRRKETVYTNFQRNLEAILNAGAHSGTKMLLSSVAVNLKDCAPFASLGATNLSVIERGTFDKLLMEGTKAQQEERFGEAIGKYQEAIKVDGSYAELRFRLGAAELAINHRELARTNFDAARDCDALPFRTDSRLNAIIREAAGKRTADTGIRFYEAENFFNTNSPAGIPGAEFFYEHVHFNFDGNYQLARAWAGAIEPFLPASVASHGRGDWASQETCEQQLGVTDWNRYSVLEDVLSRLGQAPFTNQSNHAQQVEALKTAMRDMRPHMDKVAAENARELYKSALKLRPADHRLHENYAEFLEARGDASEAAAQWELVTQLLPHHHLGFFQAGRLYLRQGKLTEAEPRLSHTVEIRPDLAEGWLLLGQVHALQGKTDTALHEFARELKIVPNDPRAYYHCGKVLSGLKRAPEAIEQFREALRLRPSFWEARYALGEELAFAGRSNEARAQFEEVIRLKPDYALAHLNLGVALFQSKEYAAALQQFEEAKRLDPKNKLAAEYVEKLGRLGR